MTDTKIILSEVKIPLDGMESMHARHASLVAEEVSDALHSFTFITNDSLTREQLTSIINDVIRDIFFRTTLVFTFQVTCDSSNNTQEVIDSEKIALRVNLEFDNNLGIFVDFALTKRAPSLHPGWVL